MEHFASRAITYQQHYQHLCMQTICVGCKVQKERIEQSNKHSSFLLSTFFRGMTISWSCPLELSQGQCVEHTPYYGYMDEYLQGFSTHLFPSSLYFILTYSNFTRKSPPQEKEITEILNRLLSFNSNIKRKVYVLSGTLQIATDMYNLRH